MPRQLRLTDDATDDLNAIFNWLEQPGSGPDALRRERAILAAIENLSTAPCRPPHGEFPGTRKLTVQRYVVVFKVSPDTGDNRTAGDVLVLRVLGPGQRQRL